MFNLMVNLYRRIKLHIIIHSDIFFTSNGYLYIELRQMCMPLAKYMYIYWGITSFHETVFLAHIYHNDIKNRLQIRPTGAHVGRWSQAHRYSFLFVRFDKPSWLSCRHSACLWSRIRHSEIQRHSEVSDEIDAQYVGAGTSYPSH